MKSRNRCFSLGITFALFATATQAQKFNFSYESEEGDYIGQGGSATWTDVDGTWDVWRNSDNGVSLDFFEAGGPSFWTLDFASEFDFELEERTYLNAERYPVQSFGRPGLRVKGEDRKCSAITGEFTVNQILYEWYGEPVRFSATFEQHCEGADPALIGSMDYDFEFGGRKLTVGNILVSYQNRIYEYNLAGELIQNIPILEAQEALPANTETTRDIVVSPDGLVHAYNGTFEPVLSTGNIVTETWRHDTHLSWNTVNNTTYGGIAVQGRYIFATDMIGTGGSGVVRFDKLDDYSSLRFREDIQYIDLNIGLDGLLYALASGGSEGGDSIDVFAPSDMTLLRTVDLPEHIRGIAVSQSGEIFGAHLFGQMYHFDANGNILNSVETTHRFADIDISEDGTIIAGANNTTIVVTNEQLNSFTELVIDDRFDMVFVTFVKLDPILLKDSFESAPLGIND